ncbi:MAG: hypothetical protein OEW35_04760 [Gammaproteobacteria bacterium]|nr:hypothetical protein [Gammaproteobacteria bacterium]MDH4256354.1 hypothetical protein [Gammaproteobacteria bacterium]
MLEREFVVAVLLGAVLAVPYLWLVQRHRRPPVPLAAGLVIAALVYAVLAVLNGGPSAILLETAATVGFATLAVAGVRWGTWLLAAGWLAHVAWDLLLHPVSHPGYARGWYPALCVGFDILVAGHALALAGRWR